MKSRLLAASHSSCSSLSPPAAEQTLHPQCRSESATYVVPATACKVPRRNLRLALLHVVKAALSLLSTRQRSAFKHAIRSELCCAVTF